MIAHSGEKNISLKTFLSDEFLKTDEQMKYIPNIAELLGKFNGGSFMRCHQLLFESTGIWIDELVPAFQRLDAMLATRDLTEHART